MFQRLTLALSALLLIGVATSSEPGKPESVPVPALAPANRVNGLELFIERGKAPDTTGNLAVDPRDRYVTVRARLAEFTPRGSPAKVPARLVHVEWVVVTAGREQSQTTEDLDPVNGTLVAGLPEPGEALYVYANAIVEYETERELAADVDGVKKKIKVKIPVNELTPHALVVVTVKEGVGTTPTERPVNLTLSPRAQGLNVIVVLDPAMPEGRALENSANFKALAKQVNLQLYFTDQTRTLGKRADVVDLVNKVRTVPCVIVASPDGKTILPSGSAHRLLMLAYPNGKPDPVVDRQNEAALVTLINRAAGG